MSIPEHMRAVVQRVASAAVHIDQKEYASIREGLLVLLGITHDDGAEDVKYICEKLEGLRIFEDADGKMNLSVQDIGGEILLVSQFTLYGDARKGRRPSFTQAARPENAVLLYEELIGRLKEKLRVQTGVFQAQMQVSLINDGPVTILLDSKRMF